MGTSIFLLGLSFGPGEKCSQSKGLQASLGWSQQSNSCRSLNSSPHPAVQAVPLSPVPGAEECPAFLLPCQLHWHFLFHRQLHVRHWHHEVLFHVGSGGGTEDPFWSEPPADVWDAFFTPLCATRQALVTIYRHRNHFLHAANCESFRTAGTHCPGKGKDNAQGKVSGSKGNPVLHQQLPGERQAEMQQWLCGFSGNKLQLETSNGLLSWRLNQWKYLEKVF